MSRLKRLRAYARTVFPLSHVEIFDSALASGFAAAIVLCWPDKPAAIVAALGIVAFWGTWFHKRRKWAALPPENPPSWERHIARSRDEMHLFTVGAFTAAGLTGGLPWSLLAIAVVALVHLARVRYRFRRTLRAREAAWEARKPRPVAQSVSAAEGVRPRHGTITRRLTGEVIEVRWIETGEKGVFMAVTVDGDPVTSSPGDQLTADQIGPGQGLMIKADIPES